MTADPHQLENIVKKVDPTLLQVMNQRLIKLQSCKADSCRNVEQLEHDRSAQAKAKSKQKCEERLTLN